MSQLPPGIGNGMSNWYMQWCTYAIRYAKSAYVDDSLSRGYSFIVWLPNFVSHAVDAKSLQDEFIQDLNKQMNRYLLTVKQHCP